MKYKIFKYASSRIDQDGNDNVHYFSKYFAPMFAYFFYKIKFSPNSVTFIFLVTGFLSALLLYWSFPIYAYLAWRLHIILDMADGSLARATKIFSSNAIGFDRSNHIIINTSILLAPLHFNGNIEIANGLIVSFYLYYFFSRNFISDKSTAINFSIKKNIIKNILGLEGYIAAQCLVIFFELYDFINFICYFYIFSFFLLFVVKLITRINK